MRKKAATGRCEGRKPYGFRDDEQPILERMRQLRSAGMAYYAIADQLNTEGLASRSNVPWRSATVWHILKREA